MGKFTTLAGVAAAIAALATPAMAEDAIAEVDAARTACEAVTASPDSYWVGWRHDFFNGYGSDFEWYDGRWDTTPTVLIRSILTDGIVYETITSCYRAEGTLASIVTQAYSPNYAQGGDSGPTIVREGHIAYDAAGKVISVTGQYADESGAKLGELSDEAFMLARGCPPVTVHLTVDSIETEYFNVLGDIEGNHPDSTASDYDWCAAVAAQ